MSEDTKVDVEEGKYTFIVRGGTGYVDLLRYGEDWRTFDDDEAVAAIVWDLQEVREEKAKLEKKLGASRKLNQSLQAQALEHVRKVRALEKENTELREENAVCKVWMKESGPFKDD